MKRFEGVVCGSLGVRVALLVEHRENDSSTALGIVLLCSATNASMGCAHTAAVAMVTTTEEKGADEINIVSLRRATLRASKMKRPEDAGRQVAMRKAEQRSRGSDLGDLPFATDTFADLFFVRSSFVAVASFVES